MIEVQEQIDRFKDFIESEYKKKLHNLINENSKSLVINFSELAKFDIELSDQLLLHPEDIIKAAEIALDSFDLKENLRVRFANLPKSRKINIRDIRSKHLDSFVMIEGIVRQSSNVRPQVTSTKFECPSCNNVITILQIDTKFKEPFRCSCGRRGRFRLLSKDLVDAQRLILEEASDELEGGDQPKRFNVFLKEDLVEPKMERKTTPGSKVRAIGIIKEIPITLKSGVQSVMYDLAMEVNNIEPIEEAFTDVVISKEDEKEIKKLAKDPMIYDKLIDSIAPSIYGHRDIKEALVMQLMGGVRKENKSGKIFRGDMHMLLVGDPGAAKSSLLLYMAKAAPKARYIAGKGATGTGMTASVVKDEFLRGWALEAGALVLANGGFAMLDELDKISQEDTSALHEALSEQTISISKANIQATLRAQTTVLAAANPKLGRFDIYQPIASQINLPPSLINRFDLIFPIEDLPNKDLDTKIASHVLEIQQGDKEKEPEIKIELFKKYVSYIRQNIFPKLTDEAIKEIKRYYVKLRNSSTAGEDELKPVPISARQLEALVRLAEASARVRLSEKVEKEDAIRAIRLVNDCLTKIGLDSEGRIDIDKISIGITTSTRSKIIVVRNIIDKFNSKGIKSIPITDIINEASENKVKESEIEEIIHTLSKEGYIFEPKRGFIQKI